MTNGGDDDGQAAVELALVLPLVALLVVGMVQVGLVVRDQVLLTHAAREAARAAAVEPSTQAAQRAVLAGAPLATERLDVRLTGPGSGGRVSVRLSFRSPTTVPLVGPLVPDVVLAAQASMRAEA